MEHFVTVMLWIDAIGAALFPIYLVALEKGLFDRKKCPSIGVLEHYQAYGCGESRS